MRSLHLGFQRGKFGLWNTRQTSRVGRSLCRRVSWVVPIRLELTTLVLTKDEVRITIVEIFGEHKMSRNGCEIVRGNEAAANAFLAAHCSPNDSILAEEYFTMEQIHAELDRLSQDVNDEYRRFGYSK